MANYPGVPSWRFAYDKDGTQVYNITFAGVVNQVGSTDIASLNDENASTGYAVSTYTGGAQKLLFFFPELRDLDAYLLLYPSASVGANLVEVSSDTTNGIDGTWATTSVSGSVQSDAIAPAYRTRIASVTILAIRAVRFTIGNPGAGQNGVVHTVHLYGEPSPGQNPNRLVMWHPTLDQRTTPAYFDWGDVPRSSSMDRTFRIKNLSSTLTAHSIRVAMDILTDTTPSVIGQHTLSTDGSTFVAQVNIGDLAPGAISAPLTLRRVTPSNAVLSLWDFRVFAEANSWS